MSQVTIRIAAGIAVLLLSGAGIWAGVAGGFDTSRYEISARERHLNPEHVQQTIRDMIIPT